MRALIASILLFAMLAGNASAAGTWTILFYMASDEGNQTHLEDATIRQMQAMVNVGGPAGVSILAQSDRGKLKSSTAASAYPDPEHGGGARYRITRGKWEYLEKLDEPNMGDPKTLLEFVKWGMNIAPAERYMLVIVSHGSGTMSWRGPGAVGARLPGEVILSNYVAYDDTDNDCLTLPELSTVLDRVRDLRGGKALEILTLDACLPSTLEAFYQLRRGCQVLVGSASQVFMGYFDHVATLNALWQQPAMAPEALADIVVRGFVNNGNQSGNQIMSALRTSAAEELIGAVDRMAQEMIRAKNEVGTPSLGNVTYYELGEDKMYWDLKVICDRLVDPATDYKHASNEAALREAARDVLEGISAAWISSWYMGAFRDNKAGGLSLYWPDAKAYTSHRSFYKVLEFAKDTHWDEFVDLVNGQTQP